MANRLHLADTRIASRAVGRLEIAAGRGTCRVSFFAAQIAARHQTGPSGRRMPLSIVFARPWRFQTVTQRYRQTFGVQFAPHVHLRIPTPRRAVATGEIDAAKPPPYRVEAIAPVHRLARRLVESVQARARRVEATSGSPTAPVNAPVPRVVRRLAPEALTTRADAAPPEPRTRLAARHDVSPAARHAVAAPPAIDVERLTEQVIKSIDRRIIAQRERFGRP
jgi:hypothetical protein